MFDGLIRHALKGKGRDADVKDLVARVRERLVTKETIKTEIGDRMRYAREISGLDQDEAAKALGYSNSAHLSLFESGKKSVPMHMLINAATVYGVSADYLLGLSDEPERDPMVAEQRAMQRHVDALIKTTSNHMVGLLVETVMSSAPTKATALDLIEKGDQAVKAINRARELNPRAFDQNLRGGAAVIGAANDLQAAINRARDRLARYERIQAVQVRIAERRAGIERPLFEDTPTT